MAYRSRIQDRSDISGAQRLRFGGTLTLDQLSNNEWSYDAQKPLSQVGEIIVPSVMHE